MFPFLAGFGPFPALQCQLVLSQLVLVVFQLTFETQVGQYLRSICPNKGNRLFETPVILSHQVGDNEGRALFEKKCTLEMPAAQWTKTLPLTSSFSISS